MSILHLRRVRTARGEPEKRPHSASTAAEEAVGSTAGIDSVVSKNLLHSMCRPEVVWSAMPQLRVHVPQVRRELQPREPALLYLSSLFVFAAIAQRGAHPGYPRTIGSSCTFSS